MSTKKHAGGKSAGKHNGSQVGKPASRAPSVRDSVIQWLAACEQPQSLDDLVGGLGLTRLRDQQTLIEALVALHEAGEVKLDRRGRYRLTAPAQPPTRAPAQPPAPSPARSSAPPAARVAGSTGKPATPVAPKPRSQPAPEAGTPVAPPGPGSVVEGVVSVRGDGYGFVQLAPELRAAGDVFVPARDMAGVLDGDRLRVRVANVDDRGRLEGRLLEILDGGRKTLTGRLHCDGNTTLLIPSDPHQPELAIAEGGLCKAKQGQVVVAEILRSGDRRAPLTARVVEVLGEYLGAGVEIEAAIRTHNLPHEFSVATLDEAAAFGDTVAVDGARHDLRDLPLVTIDGADARDFDDAVCAQPVRGGGWRLWVAIADVSHYVRPGSALDTEAIARGTSVYFPERVVPMLPEALSNGLCSLNPDVDRLCMVCEMRIGATGETRQSRFYPAVMRSHARLIYEQVAALLDNPKGADLARRHPELVAPLQVLDAAFGALFQARTARGAIDFESTETRVVFGADRKIEAIVPTVRTRAHRIIEECMIAANVAAAKFVGQHETPAPFRVHATPDPEKVEVLREFLNARGLSLGGGAVPEPADYQRVVASLEGRDDAGLVQQTLLRSLMQARYAATDDGHFGLALEHYAHFTSPIRRYPDLLLHRAIKYSLAHRKAGAIRHILGRHKADTTPSTAAMGELADHCSMTERRADEATRDVMSWLKCEYMSHHVGEEFDGIVTGVTSFGVFVELEGLYIDGMVHISRLGHDYFEFDARRHRVVGSRSGAVFALGTKMRVKVVRAGLDDRKIDLEPVATRPSRRKRPA